MKTGKIDYIGLYRILSSHRIQHNEKNKISHLSNSYSEEEYLPVLIVSGNHKVIDTTYKFTNFSLGYLRSKLTLSHYSQKAFQNVESLPMLQMGSN